MIPRGEVWIVSLYAHLNRVCRHQDRDRGVEVLALDDTDGGFPHEHDFGMPFDFLLNSTHPIHGRVQALVKCVGWGPLSAEMAQPTAAGSSLNGRHGTQESPLCSSLA